MATVQFCKFVLGMGGVILSFMFKNNQDALFFMVYTLLISWVELMPYTFNKSLCLPAGTQIVSSALFILNLALIVISALFAFRGFCANNMLEINSGVFNEMMPAFRMNVWVYFCVVGLCQLSSTIIEITERIRKRVRRNHPPKAEAHNLPGNDQTVAAAENR